MVLKDVPVDVYMLREIGEDWTWTYDDEVKFEPVKVQLQTTGTNTVTVTHSADVVDWLHDEAHN